MKRNLCIPVILTIIALFLTSMPAFSYQIYDDFSETYINPEKWKERKYVREVTGGKLVSKAANSIGSGVENNTHFRNRFSINVIQADITVVRAVLDTGSSPYSCARVQGWFYNTKTSGGATGDIWAGIFIGERGSGLETWWIVLESLNDELNSYEIKGTGSIIPPGELVYGTSCTAKLTYDGNNGFKFNVNGQEDTFSGPTRQRASVAGYKTLTTRVFTDGENGTGYISALFDNVYINNEGTVYDDFSTGPLDQTKWESPEFVREISGGKLRMNFQAGEYFGSAFGTAIITPKDQSSPYLESKVAIQTGSEIPDGVYGYSGVRGFFYNDSRGPGSGLPYNGNEGDVVAANRLVMGADGGLHAQCYAVRYNTADASENTDLFWHTFETAIDYDTDYSLSIDLRNTMFIFKCNNEIFQYNITTPQYEPSTGKTRYLRSYTHPKLPAYFKTSFDNVCLSNIAYVNTFDSTCNGKNPCYTSIQTAIRNETTGTIIRVANGTYTETILFDESKYILIQGSWNTTYTEQNGITIIENAPKVTRGSLTLQELKIQPE